MKRPTIDGGTIIAAAIAAATILLALLTLARIQPTSQVLGSAVTAPLTRLEAPLQKSTTSTSMPPPPAALIVTTAPPATVGPGETFYRDCPEARSAGVVDLRRGDPGYRAQLDRDADGRACESPPVPSTAPPPAVPAPPRPALSPVPQTATQRPTPTRSTTTPLRPPLTFPQPILTTPLPPPTTPPPSEPPPTTTTTEAPTTTEPLPPPAPTTTPPPRFTDCNQLVEAGLDLSLTSASPWWNPALDVDGDGFACEDDSPTPPPSTTSTTITPPLDCVAAWDLGLAPILPDSPYWNPAWDPDGRGIACAADPRVVTVVSSTSSTTQPAGDGR